MAEPNISKEVWVEDLEKLSDGSFKKKNHIAKAKNGTTFDEHLADDATLSSKGHVQLSNSVTSTSNALSATPSAVKTAMDRANAAFQQANDAKGVLAPAINAKGVAASPSDTFSTLASKIGQISTGKKWASGTTLSSSDAPSFSYSSGDAHGSYYVQVSGLDFVPSLILVTGQSIFSVYSSTMFNDGFSGYSPTVTIKSKRVGTASSFFVYAIDGNKNAGYVNSSGFRVPVEASGIMTKWIAIE